MKNPTAQINGTLTAIWVVPNERDYQLFGFFVKKCIRNDRFTYIFTIFDLK